MYIIPAIDIISGECVRLSKGDYDTKKVYSKSPVDVAKMYSELGFKRLHVVDLDGARSSAPKNLRILEKMVSATSLDIQYGGGIKTETSLRSVLDAGASRVICGTVAVTSPDLFIGWLEHFGSQRVILGADFRGDFVAVSGWEKQTDLMLDTIVENFYTRGLRQMIATDISKDGMLCGPDYQKYYKLNELFPDLKITISGGISSINDIKRIDRTKIECVIVGKAIYEGRINIEELSRC